MAGGAHSASGLFVSGSGGGGANSVSTEGLHGYEGTRTDVGRRYGLGTVRWVGESPALGPGVWAGVELDQKLGKHDGTVFGMRYFVCPDGHGLMTRVEKLAPAKTYEEGDKRVLAAARSHNAKLRQRSASRQGRPASRQDVLDGNFAERAFSAARDNRAVLGLAIGDAAKNAAQSTVRAAKLRARAMAENERTSGSATWQIRAAAKPAGSEEPAAAESHSDQVDDKGSADGQRERVLGAGSRASQRSTTCGSDGRAPTSIPTDDELALLASALGEPQESSPSAATWPWAVGPAVDETSDQTEGLREPDDSPRVDPTVESAAAASLDVDPQHLRAVFEAARAATASAGSDNATASTQDRIAPLPKHAASALVPEQQLPKLQPQGQEDEDDEDDSKLCEWAQDEPTSGAECIHDSPVMEMTSKMRRSREGFGAELTNSSHGTNRVE